MRSRVVITGLGCVTPLGGTPEQTWDGLTQGRSGVGPLTLFDASRYPVRIAAQVRDWSLADSGADPAPWEHAPRQTRFAVGAALDAARRAGLPDSRVDAARFGVYLGCGEAFEDFPSFIQSVADVGASGTVDTSRFLRAA